MGKSYFLINILFSKDRMRSFLEISLLILSLLINLKISLTAGREYFLILKLFITLFNEGRILIIAPATTVSLIIISEGSL